MPKQIRYPFQGHYINVFEEDLQCGFCKEMIDNPVIAGDGYSYCATHLEKYVKDCSINSKIAVSPLNRAIILTANNYPNFRLKNIIEDFKKNIIIADYNPFLDNISMTLFFTPCVADDGHSYDILTIKNLLLERIQNGKEGIVSPNTRKEIDIYRSNEIFEKIIIRFKEGLSEKELQELSDDISLSIGKEITRVIKNQDKIGIALMLPFLTPSMVLLLGYQLKDKEMIEKALLLGADNSWIEERPPIIQAIRTRIPLDLIETLVESGASVDSSDLENGNPVYWAVATGQVEIVKYLLKNGGIPLVSKRAGKFNLTPIYVAINNEHEEIARLLLPYCNKDLINTVFENINTLLYIAIENNFTKLVKELLEAEADPNIDSKSNSTILLACKKGNVELIKALLEKGVDLKSQPHEVSPLFLSVDKCRNDIVEILLKYHERIDQKDIAECLVLAILKENEPIINFLIPYCTKEILNLHISESKIIILKAAIEKGMTDLVRKILYKGADPNLLCMGYTPLMWAAVHGHIDIARLLIQAGADINALSIPGEHTALFIAATAGKENFVDFLLQYKPKINQYCYSTKMQYKSTTTQYENDIMIREISKTYLIPLTALTVAFINQHLSIAEKLIEAGASIEITDDYDRLYDYLVKAEKLIEVNPSIQMTDDYDNLCDYSVKNDTQKAAEMLSNLKYKEKSKIFLLLKNKFAVKILAFIVILPSILVLNYKKIINKLNGKLEHSYLLLLSLTIFILKEAIDFLKNEYINLGVNKQKENFKERLERLQSYKNYPYQEENSAEYYKNEGVEKVLFDRHAISLTPFRFTPSTSYQLVRTDNSMAEIIRGSKIDGASRNR